MKVFKKRIDLFNYTYRMTEDDLNKMEQLISKYESGKKEEL